MNTYLLFPGGKPKALTFSYDDGVRDDIRLVEIFKKHGLFGTFNVNSGIFEAGGNRLTADEVKDLYIPAGQELSCHTLTHPWLEKLPDDMALFEVMEDRKRLEALSGKIIRGMAYPYGTYNDRTVELLQAAGIAYCRTTVSTNDFRLPADWLKLTATCHHNGEKLFEHAEKFVNATPSDREHGWLFYVWGHSYEFPRDNNWDRIEKFAEQVSGKADVWYATNMQIYEYITAYRSLQYSLDGKLVHNPTALDVWFRANSTTYLIPAGETAAL